MDTTQTALRYIRRDPCTIRIPALVVHARARAVLTRGLYLHDGSRAGMVGALGLGVSMTGNAFRVVSGSR